MTAEEILEEIEYPLENLQNLLFAFSKMKVDDGLKEQEFSAIIKISFSNNQKWLNALVIGNN